MLKTNYEKEAGIHTEIYCKHCGELAGDQLYVSAGDTYCSENCFLKTRDVCAEQEDAYTLLAETLVGALDLREHETGLHSKRVACHTLVLARRFTSDINKLKQIYWGALLHDIGKIGIPDVILLKQGSLTESEWAEVRKHPENGYSLISQVHGMSEAAQIILYHEERYDGSGYPKGLSGNEISLGARLFMVIDTLDAMTSDRPYRSGASFEAAKEEILRMEGSQFDPVAVDVFREEEKVLREMVLAKCHNPASFFS